MPNQVLLCIITTMMRATVNPLTLPSLPLVTGDENREEVEKIFSTYETNFYATLEENRKRFRQAMKYISLCAFLQGFTHSFSFKPYNVHTHHYSWCPAEKWYPEITTFGKELK